MRRLFIGMTASVGTAFGTAALAWTVGFVFFPHANLDYAFGYILGAFWLGFVAGGAWWWRRSRRR